VRAPSPALATGTASGKLWISVTERELGNGKRQWPPLGEVVVFCRPATCAHGGSRALSAPPFSAPPSRF
jgi:hypothetical protein